jgi:hypothetical protein
MRRIAALVLCLSGAVAAAGCFDIEQTLTLDKNLAGKAGFSMKVDMEPMVGFMVRMQREMEGKKGEPTAAEIEAAKKEMLKDGKPETATDFEKDKKDFAATLPKGVTLLDASFKDEGLKFAMNFAFGFDNVSKLAQINFPKKDAGGGAPGGNPIDAPFDNLVVKDEGQTILVTSSPQNPMSDSPMAQGPPDPDAAKMIGDMMKGFRVAFKISSPMAVVEQNATRKEGDTLIWEYNFETIQKMTPEQAKQIIKVRYKK